MKSLKMIVFLLMFIFISISYGGKPGIEFYKTASPQYVEDERTITYRLTIVNTTNDDMNLSIYDKMALLTTKDINISVIDYSAIDDQNITCTLDRDGKTSELFCSSIFIISGASKQLLYTLESPNESLQIENNATLYDLDDNNATISEASLTVTVLPSYEGNLEYERDLCYIAPNISDGDVCYQSGSFIYGSECTSEITIIHNSETDLKNVHVFKAYTSAIEWDECYASTGVACGTSDDKKDLDILLNRDSSLYFKNAFDEAQDFDLGNITFNVDTNRTLTDINTIPLSSKRDPITSFEYIALIAQYNYDTNDSTNDTIEEYVYPCDGNYSGTAITQLTSGGINDVDLQNIDITANNAADYINYTSYKKVGTKIVNQPFILGVTYLNKDGTPSEYDGNFGRANENINAPVILEYKAVDDPDSAYELLWAGEFPNGEEYIFTTESNLNDGANQNAYPVIEKAFREGEIKIQFTDYGSFFRSIDNLNCGSSSLESGLCLVPACLNSATQILTVFPLDTYPHVATCIYGDGGGAAPCDSNAYYGNCGGKKVTISPPKYDNDYGCAMCLADATALPTYYKPFSSRPKDFSLAVPDLDGDGLYEAGADHLIDLNATTGTNNPSNSNEINNATRSPSYGTILEPYTLEGDYPSEVIAVIGLENNDSLTCPDDNNYSQTISFINGYSVGPINYPNVGQVKLVIMDQNWTSVDQNASSPNNSNCILESNETNPVLDPQDHGRVGCMIFTEKSMRFIPDQFYIDANLTDHNYVSNFTYLHDINLYNSDDNYSMGAELTIDIKAMGADGNVTSNYIENCYAQETELNLKLGGTDITYPSSQPAITQFLYYNPEEYDPAIPDSGEGEHNFTSTTSPISIATLPIDNVESTFHDDALDGNGTAHIEYKLNFDRKIHLVVNPFRMELTDINITDTDNVEGNKTGILDQNATMHYARARASKFFYEDITDPNATTPIAADVYCDFSVYDECKDLGIRTDTGAQTNELYWWLSFGHLESSTQHDGNVTLQTGAIIEGSGAPSISSTTTTDPANVQIISDGIQPNVTVTANDTLLPMTVLIELVNKIDSGSPGYDASASLYTNHWLIYNKNSATVVPSPFYKVRFIGDANWTGEGQTGHVIELEASYKKSQRVDW